VTDTRKRVKEYRKKINGSLSFTAYLTSCLRQTVDENKLVHAYRSGGRLIIYNNVDFTTRSNPESKRIIYPMSESGSIDIGIYRVL
jgi:predicted ATP-dependent Lon-type protease